MGCFFLNAVTQKAAVIYICTNFLRSAAQRGQPIQVLYEYHFEQYHWIHVGSAVILAVQWLYHIVYLMKVHGCIDLASVSRHGRLVNFI